MLGRGLCPKLSNSFKIEDGVVGCDRYSHKARTDGAGRKRPSKNSENPTSHKRSNWGSKKEADSRVRIQHVVCWRHAKKGSSSVSK